MNKKTAAFVVSACCILCLNEQWIAVMASPRAMLVYVLALWLRCEWCVHQNKNLTKETKCVCRGGGVKENYELSQTVMNLSEQHRLLCEIRNTGLKSLKYSKDTFIELRFPSTIKRSASSSFRSTPSSESTPEAKSTETCQPASPLPMSTEAMLKSKAAFRRGSNSENGLSKLMGNKTKEL